LGSTDIVATGLSAALARCSTTYGPLAAPGVWETVCGEARITATKLATGSVTRSKTTTGLAAHLR